MIYRTFHLLTHFGDSALLAPLSLAIIGILFWSGSQSVAWRFALSVGTLMASIVVLKGGFYAIGGDTSLNVLSPSGHAGFSVTVYGCCAAVLATQLRPAAATAMIAATMALLAAVLVSRVFLGAHTPEEVILGGAVGLFCAAAFVFRNPNLGRLRLRLPVSVVLALAVGSVCIWTVGRRFDTEGRIEQWGILVGSSLGTLSPSDLVPGYEGQAEFSIRRLPQ